MKPSKILSLLLCILMVCTIAFAGCSKKDDSSKNSSSADEVSTLTATQEITTAASTENSTEAVTEVRGTTKATEAAPSKQNNKDNQDISSNAGPVDSQEQKPMTCTVTVSERDYTFELGDKFTYTCFLNTPDKIEDIQAQVLYTGNCLKLVSTEREDIFPIIGNSAIYNLNNPGIIKYNALEITGMDFDKEGVLVTLTFEVIFGGSASVSNSIEVMTGIDGTLYADLFKLKDDVKIRETIG